MKRSISYLMICLSLVAVNLPGFCFGLNPKVTVVDGGDSYTVVLREDGTVWTYGANGNGQLGQGTNTYNTLPTRVAILSDIVSLAAGQAHCLAIKKDGTVWAWGWNANGQLGDGTTTDQPTPVQVKDPIDPTGFLTGVIAVAGGERHSLALKANGTVWAWGYNYSGQLGDGTGDGKVAPVQVKDPSDPSGFLKGVTAIAAGASHSIALKNGTVWTWGSQGYLQLGRITWQSGFPAQNVAGPVAGLSNVKAISAGWEHTVVLKTDGTVWACGRNTDGQLGDGTTIGSNSSSTPPKLFVQVILPADPTGHLSGIVAISARDRYVVAVKGDGTVWGWGSNTYGSLCDGTSNNAKTTAIQMKDPSDPTGFLTGVTKVGIGADHSEMLKTDGSVWGCGANYWGQLGTESNDSPKLTPAEAHIPEYSLIFAWGSGYITPGEEATFLVEYDNVMTETLQNAVALFTFPKSFQYVSCTGGGIFRRDMPSNQVFWKLGDIPSGARGQMAVKVEVPWGLPLHSKGTVWAELGAPNILSTFDVADYLAWQPNVIAQKDLTESEIADALASDPNLQALLTYATTTLGRYLFLNQAVKFEYQDGGRLTCLILLDSKEFGPAFLYSDGKTATIQKFDGTKVSLFDADGGYSQDLLDGSLQIWGRWAETGSIRAGAESPLSPASVSDSALSPDVARCMVNCALNTAPGWVNNLGSNLAKTQQESLRDDCRTCQIALSVGEVDKEECAKCLKAWSESMEEYSDEALKCVYDCQRHPDHHVCTSTTPLSYCEDRTWNPLTWTRPSRGIAILQRCIPSTGTLETDKWTLVCDPTLDEVCKDGACVTMVEGGVCQRRYPTPTKPLPGGLLSGANGIPIPGSAALTCNINLFSTSTYEAKVSHDPNAKLADVKGDVVPGAKITYTIEFENLGTGTAYGVFIQDQLDPNLDEGTLVINNGGSYRPSTRLLTWEIGTLPPGGKGSVSFSINVKPGLPSGTPIVNQANVYFPSANEITPTNPVVYTVKAIVADPQTVETTAGTATTILLTGRDTGSRTLTYRILSGPNQGTCAGTPPTVTYTSVASFAGQDEFSFVVNNGLVDSDPAKIRINVNPNPLDTTPPTVLSTFPNPGATGVHINSVPVSTNPNAYVPQITALFSKPIDGATVTTGTFTVNGGITGSVSYDEQTMTAYFIPSKPLSPSTTYTAKLTSGIKDKAGHAMAGDYSWQFATVSPANIVVTLPDDATEVNFGDVLVNLVSPEKIVNVQNTGTSNLVLGTITETGTNPGDFKITEDKCSGKTLGESDNCTVKTAFQPSSLGSKSASLSIPSNDADTPTASVALKGKGSGPSISVTPLSIVFGYVAVGGSAEQTVTVRSAGTSSLIIGTIGQPSAPFSQSGGSCTNGQVLASGSSCTVVERFAPTSGDTFNSSFSVPSNDPGKPSVTISLSGTGGTPDITVSPAEVNFGKTLKGGSSDRTITVRNDGNGSLVLSGIGSPSAPFSMAAGGTCTASTTLLPAGSCTIVIRFSPTAQGAASSKFDITSNDPDEGTVSVSLSGEGALLVVSPAEGTIGSLLTITGSGFGGKKGKVTVGAVALKIVDWSSSTIHATLGKAMQPDMAYDVVVAPGEPRGAKPITEPGAFTVREPEVTGGPYHGSPKATVTVTGKFFGTTKGKVYVGSSSCRVLSWGMNNAVTGESTVVFVVPTKIAKGSYDLGIINTVGSGTAKFTVD